jgi:hypothetical protein
MFTIHNMIYIFIFLYLRQRHARPLARMRVYARFSLVQVKYLENQQLRTVQSLLANAAQIKVTKLQKQVIDLQHQQFQDNNELRRIQEHEKAIREEIHSKATKVIQEAQAQ